MTVIEAVNVVLSALPARWPLPLPVTNTVTYAAIALAINAWVTYDSTGDLVLNKEILGVINLDSKCGYSTYDYVVVGGGGAGIVVATRIASASSKSSVLLLEAGGEPSVLNEIPTLDTYLTNQPANTWIYESTPQTKAGRNSDNKGVVSAGGKMLGGSTATDFMTYVRGNKEDFNRWAQDVQDPSWNYENLLPYFKKSEDYHGAYAGEADASTYHGKGGLLNVDTFDYMPGVDQFLAAAEEKGYSIGDYNGANQEVFSKLDVTTQDGRREHTYRAFYQDTGKPSNLCIKKFADVTKVNFKIVNGKPKAVGVTYKRHDVTLTVSARKEVILSAGTFGSAKLLMLSGVGPADHLRSLNIPVIKDLPVGQNLQDHLFTLVGPFLLSPSFNPNRDVTVQAASGYVVEGNGALAAPGGMNGIGFLTSSVAQPDYPDLQAVHLALSLHPELPRDFKELFGLDAEIMDQWLTPYHLENTDARWVVLYGGRPNSVGTVTLASDDPNASPIINPNYLADPKDLEALLFGFKKIVDLFENTDALDHTPLFDKPVPGCESLEFKSDDYYRCAILHNSGSAYHHVGTCALGQVVDNKLKVKGIQGLRVIDASIMHRIPNGNTPTPTIMVAEKGADLIIADM